MELFDLEIPIRSTGLDATRQDFRALEQAGTESAKRVETALARTAPPASVAAGFTRTATSATQATAAVEGVGRAATGTASAEASLAAAQQRVATGLQGIAKDILQAKAAFDAGTLSADELGVALATARQQAVALKGGLALPTAQAEAFRVIMSATVPALAAADGAMRIIATDIKQASAAFKAGTISAEDYAVALQTARAQAIAASQGTQLAGTELSAFNTILRQTEQRSGPARQGLGTMRSSMLGLAATMVGTRSTAGTLAGALLQFSIGNPLAVGVSAGILAIVVLYEKLTDATRKAKAETDKLIESLRKERDERIAAEHPELPFQATAGQLRERQAQLQQQLDAARRGRAVPLPGGDVRIEVDTEKVTQLQQQIRDLDTLQLEALRRENEAQTALTDARRADLVTLVQAGTATKEDQAALRQELARTKAELAGMSEATRATTEGRARAATLTERITTIEGAFAKTTAQSTKAQKDAVAAIRDRVDLTLALGEQQGFTTARLDDLRTAVAALDRLQQTANLTDAQQLTLLKARTEALAALTKASSAAIPNQNRIGLPAVPQLVPKGPAGPSFPTSLAPEATPQLFGSFGDQAGGAGGSLAKSFTDAIISGIEKARAAVASAIDESIVGPMAAKAELLKGIGQTMGDALRAGLTTVLTTGIAALVTGHGDVLLNALGGILTQMGEAMVATGVAMLHLLPALSNPFTSGPALIAAGALIAGLGIALSSVATGSGGAHAGGSRGGTSLQPINQTFTISSGSRTAPVAQTEAKASALKTTPVSLTVNHFGGRDPAFGRWLGDQISAAQARGAA